MYVLVISSSCQKKCIEVCHAEVDEFIFRIEDGEIFLVRNRDVATNKYEMKLLRIKCLCPLQAITFEPFEIAT